MLLANNTPQQLFYSISNAVSADCGSINAGIPPACRTTTTRPTYRSVFGQQHWPQRDAIHHRHPSTGTGKAVTLGLYVE